MKINVAAKTTVIPSTPCITDIMAKIFSRLGSSVDLVKSKIPINKSIIPNMTIAPMLIDNPMFKKVPSFCVTIFSGSTALAISRNRVLIQRILIAERSSKQIKVACCRNEVEFHVVLMYLPPTA